MGSEQSRNTRGEIDNRSGQKATARDLEIALEQQRRLYEQRMQDLLCENRAYAATLNAAWAQPMSTATGLISTPSTTNHVPTPSTTRQLSTSTSTARLSTPTTTARLPTPTTTALATGQQTTPTNTRQLPTASTSRQLPTASTSTQVSTPSTTGQLSTPTSTARLSTPTTTARLPTPTTTALATGQQTTPTNTRQLPTASTSRQLPTASTSRQLPTASTSRQVPTPSTTGQLFTPTSTARLSTPTTTARLPTPTTTALATGLQTTPTNTRQLPTASTTRQVPTTSATSTLHAPSTAILERSRPPYNYKQKDLRGAILSTHSLYPNLDSEYMTVSPENREHSPNNQRTLGNSSPAPATTNSSRFRSRSNSRSQRGKKNRNHDIICQTCGEWYEDKIYQCNQGHSSCNSCKMRQVACGQCRQQLTNRRNYDLEKYVSERMVKCRNWNCIFSVKMKDMEDHMRNCYFNVMLCVSLEDCIWSGKLNELSKHFDEMHPTHRQGDVNKEMFLSDICNTSHTMHLVQIGSFHFLFHVHVSETKKRICLVARLIGTKHSAAKWMYEIHVYNKREPRRKFQYTDRCLAMNETIDEIVGGARCAVIPQEYANTFICDGVLAYKFFIKRDDEIKTMHFVNRNHVATAQNNRQCSTSNR